MIAIPAPLSFYTDKLNSGEQFSLARYGDGELQCLFGWEGGNCDGCDYTPELKEGLTRSLSLDEPDLIHGLQRVLPKDEIEFVKLLVRLHSPITDWYDTDVFTESLMAGEFYPMIEALRSRPTVIVSNATVRRIRSIISYELYIETPTKNSYEHVSTIANQILMHSRLARGPIVYLLSCGMTATVLVSELHGRVNGWLIDIGHIWDVFLGRATRSYAMKMTREQIEKNLCPPER